MSLTRIVSVLLVAASLQLAGCAASFPRHRVADAPPAPFLTSTARPRIHLDVKVYSGGPGLEALPLAYPGSWRTQVEQTLTRSGLFSAITAGGKSAVDGELRVSVYQHNISGPAVLGRLFTLLSLGVIPSSATIEYTVRLSVRDREGKELFRDTRSDALVEWVGFALLPVRDLEPEKARNAILDNLLRTELKAALDAGALPPALVSASGPTLP